MKRALFPTTLLRFPRGALVASLAFALSACGGPEDQVLGKEYRSTTTGDVGLGPDGPVSGSLTISFERRDVVSPSGTEEGNVYSRQLSDYYESGLFSFDGNTILLESFNEAAAPLEATYDAETDSLQLDGRTYVFYQELDSY